MAKPADTTHLSKKKKRGKGAAFLRQAIQTKTDECLVWPYATSRGYGMASVAGKQIKAHVWICLQAHGPKPFPEAHAAHSCGNSLCVNPQHVRWASVQENIDDKKLHGRQTRGTAVNTAVLTEEQVLKIVNDPRPYYIVAAEYGCGTSTIASIHRGKSWRHVTGINPKSAPHRCPRWPFTETQIAEIKSDPRSCHAMARVIGCSADTINKIRRGLRAA